MPDVDPQAAAGRPVIAAPGFSGMRPFAIATIWNLQGDPQRADLRELVGEQFGCSLPTQPNTATAGPGGTVLWVGPKSWLLLGDTQQPLAAFVAQRDALNAAGGALFDISAARVAFQVSGARAAELLAGFCPLDLQPTAFPVGTCAQSLFGHVNALYYAHATGGFTVFVARSLYQDTWQALCEAARRYDFTIQESARFTATPGPH